jgi:drug/metabolite transporter (DMT)-like permease
MSWLVFAFSGPVLWGISFHLDKYLVDRYFKSTDVAVLLVFTALIGVLALPVIFYYQPEVTALSRTSILFVALAGALYMAAMLFYLRALQTEDVSIVAPLFQAAPIFASGLGYIVLGEVLTQTQLLGGLAIVLGAASLSWQGRGAPIRLRLIGLMLVCTFSLAVASLIFKVFAIRDDFWPTTFWTYAGEAVFGFAILLVPAYRRQFVALFRTHRAALLTVNASNELINLGGGLGVRYALLLAPLGIVQAIGSTTSLFVFLFGVGLALFAPSLGGEDFSPRNLVRKALGAILISAGVLLVNR